MATLLLPSKRALCHLAERAAVSAGEGDEVGTHRQKDDNAKKLHAQETVVLLCTVAMMFRPRQTCFGHRFKD